jgi:hypothetical protein
MIICRITDGMGNQLFQYCLAKHLATIHKCELKLELGYFKSANSWPFRLDHFGTSHDGEASEAEVAEVSARDAPWRRLLPAHLRVFARDKNKKFQPDTLRFRPPCILEGYWQSERYFKSIEPVLRDELQIGPEHLSHQYYRVLEEIQVGSSVSLALRRGDYVTLGAPLATVDYYERAIARVKTFVSDPKLVIFSDDIPWVKANLPIDLPVRWIEQGLQLKDYERMQLMSGCQHHIIGNSTFNWWGAWLNQDERKRVIYPEIALSHLSRDLMLPNWEML